MNQVNGSKSYEADVVIVGFGGAGAAAAITAADAGAHVLILEKQSEGGGNTRLSAGSVRTFADLQDAAAYIEFLCEGSTDSDILRAFLAESRANPQWLGELGGTVRIDPLHEEIKSYPVYHAGPAFPWRAGAKGVGPRIRVQGAQTANGRDLWRLLAENAVRRNIPVLYGVSAEKIVREVSGEVSGVRAHREAIAVSISARRGVVLACGGFECDSSMHLQYLGQRFFTLGGPAHTGEGVRMAAAVGADLWHMSAVAAGFGYKVPEFECAILHAMPAAGFLYVDGRGLRFVDEGAMDAHAVGSLVHEVDLKALRRTRVPCFVIFDEKTRLAGAVANTERGFISGQYQWSGDNSSEIRRGWLSTCDSIEGLARKVGLEEQTLEQSVSRYNLACKNGYDSVFGRSRETLVPVVTPPFYAAALWPSLFNTQGGPRRNSRSQVIDVWGKPIPRLYSAGELGSIWGQHYPGASNLTEALAFGRMAGRNAAAEQPRT